MQTECSPTLFEFELVERHKAVAGFDGGIITSDAGGLLLGRLCQSQPKIAHFCQSKIAHFGLGFVPPDAVLGVSDLM